LLLLHLAPVAAIADVSVTFNSSSDTGPSLSGLTATNQNLNVTLGFAPPTGTVLTAVNNTSTAAVTGGFLNAVNGGTIRAMFGGRTFFFEVRHDGGDGNDVTLTAVDWGHLNSGGGGEVLFLKRDARVAGRDVLYIGSDVAGVWRSWNAGQSWEQLVPWRMVNTQDWMPDPSDAGGFFVAEQYGVWRVAGGGHAWTLYGTLPSQWPSVLGAAVDSGSGELVVYAGIGSIRQKNIPSGAVAGVFKRVGLGAWTALNVTASGTTLSGAVVGMEVNASNPQQLWICCPQGVFYSEDGGSTWELRNAGLPAGNVNDIVVNPGSFSTDAICCVQNGGVFRWSTGSWVNMGVFGSAVGTETVPGLLPTATPWESIATDTAYPFGERLMVNIPATGSTGDVFYTQTGNTASPQWAERSRTLDQSFFHPPGSYSNASVLHNNVAYVARTSTFRSGNITTSTNAYIWAELYSRRNGTNALSEKLWSERGYENTVAGALAASPVDPARILLGRYDMGLWLSTDGGVTWANKNKQVNGSLIRSCGAAVFNPFQPTQAFYGGRNVFADAPGDSAIFVSEDAGDTWTDITTGTSYPSYDHGPQDFAFAHDGTLFVAADPEQSPYTGKGGIWQRVTSPAADWTRIGLEGYKCRTLSLPGNSVERMLVGTTNNAGVYYGRKTTGWAFTRILNTNTTCWQVRFDPGDPTTAYAAMGIGLYRLNFAPDGTFLSTVKILEGANGVVGTVNAATADAHGRVFATIGYRNAEIESVSMSVNRGVTWTNLKSDLPGTAVSLGVLETAAYPSGDEFLLLGTAGTGAFQRRAPEAGAIMAVKNGGSVLTHALSTVDFGAVALGPGSTVTLTITNRGVAPMNGIRVSTVGTHADDYPLTQPLPSLAPGSSSTFDVTFSPLNSGTRTATLRIASNATDQGMFDIALTGPGQTLQQSWRQQYFGTTANTGNAADGFDFDKDGLVNLLEWACGLNPTLSSTANTSAVLFEGEVVFNYTRSVAAVTAGAVFTVEWSDTLPGTGWSAAGVTQTELTNSGTLQQMKATLPAGSLGRRFVRLRVTSPP
jgi:hypothetical protein